MGLTVITITGSFERPDGQPAQGTVTATLSDTLRNGTEIVIVNAVHGELDKTGALKDSSGEQPFTLLANNDPGSTPVDSSYAFVIELDCASPDPFSAVVPFDAADGTVDIDVLMP